MCIRDSSGTKPLTEGGGGVAALSPLWTAPANRKTSLVWKMWSSPLHFDGSNLRNGASYTRACCANSASDELLVHCHLSMQCIDPMSVFVTGPDSNKPSRNFGCESTQWLEPSRKCDEKNSKNISSTWGFASSVSRVAHNMGLHNVNSFHQNINMVLHV